MKIEVKSKWGEINLREFISIAEIETEKETEGRAIAKRVKIISLLSGVELKELYKLNTKGFEKLIKATSFLDKEPKEDKNPIRIDGVTYKAVELNKLTVGENISIEQLLTEAQNTGRNIMADLIAILIREVKDGKVVDFDPDTLQARKELFLERLTVGFFLKLMKAFTNGVSNTDEIIKKYSSQQDTEQTVQKKKKTH